MANIKISQLVTGVPGPSSVFPYTEAGSTYKGFVSGLTTNYVEVTKNELDSLIQTSSLVPGYFYIISGVDVELFSGTTIILESVSTSELDFRGVGLFYNPNYNQTQDGYGVWNKYITPQFVSISGGTFQYQETVTNDLGGTAVYLSDEFLEWSSGDWTGASNITGNSSSTLATISNSYTPNYNSGDTAIWGGLVWVSDGSLGNATDKYTLSGGWTVIPYNTTNYTLVADEIIYDYDKDKIVYRKDKYGNEVYCNYQSISKFEIDGYGNPIKDFQWGNNQVNWGITPGLYLFNDVPSTSDDINIGGNDMFDVGNILNTNIFSQIPYTHTQMTYPPINENNEAPNNSFLYDGVVASGDTYFGTGSQYFTNLYPGLFVMAADNVAINRFYIDGNLGTDCDSSLDSYQMTYQRDSGFYTAFVKRFYDNVNLEPSNNHIIIVDTDGSGIVHDYNSGGCDSDYHDLSGLSISNVSKIYYLLISLFPNQKIDDTQVDEIVNTFLTLVENKTIGDSLTALTSNYTSITSQFGISQTLNKLGVMGNKITDSYFDCLNFMGGSIWNNNISQNTVFTSNIFAPIRDNYFSLNNFDSESFMSGNTFSPRFGFENNKVSYSEINDNIFSTYDNYVSGLRNCNFKLSSFYENALHNTVVEKSVFDSDSNMSLNNFDDSYFSDNLIGMGCEVMSNVLTSSNLTQVEISDNSEISNNYIIMSVLSQNTLVDSLISDNTLIDNCGISQNVLQKSSVIQNNNFYQNSFLQKNNLDQQSIIENNSGFTNSYIEFNNLFYSKLSGNTLDNSSFIQENVLTNYSEISENMLDNASFVNNNSIENGSYILSNTIDGGSEISQNTLSVGYVYQNMVQASTISRNVLNIDSEIYLNDLNASNIWKNNLTSESSIYNGTLDSSLIQHNYLKNTTIDLLKSCVIDTKNISNTNFVDSVVNEISENSDVIYQSFSKNVFTNSSGITRISYYDGSDSLIIGDINDSVLPTLNITGWSAVSSYSLSVVCDITLDGGTSITDRGVVWGTSPYPTVTNNVVSEGGTGTGLYTTSLTGLTSGSTIYFRGYAVNTSGTGYTCQDTYETP